MGILNFFRKERDVKNKLPSTLDEVPYPEKRIGSMNLRNDEMTREMLDVLPEFLEIEGLGKIIRSREPGDEKSQVMIHSIFHGMTTEIDPKSDSAVQSFLEVRNRHPIFDQADRLDRMMLNHMEAIMMNLMWLPPEKRLPMLNTIKAGVSALDNDPSKIEFVLASNDFSKVLHDYWKEQGYTVQEALNYNPDESRRGMNNLMKQLDIQETQVAGKMAVPKKSISPGFSARNGSEWEQ